MTGFASLAGQVQLFPGRPLPAIRNSRPQLADRVSVGVLAQVLPQRLGALFTLCSAAHQIASRQAVAPSGTPRRCPYRGTGVMLQTTIT